MRLAIDVMLDYSIADPCDILLLVEAAAVKDQRLELQDLRVHSPEPLRAVIGQNGIGQRTWARGEGAFRVEYRAVVAIDRPAVDLGAMAATPLRMLPAETVPYLLPSRYCESDRFQGFIEQEFAGLDGGALAAALSEWVRTSLTYESGTSSGVTTALMTFADRHGVCRDYAHLLVALARAGGIPARCVSAYAPGVDPPDFHAVAELWLAGGWHLVDSTGMSSPGEVARVAVGRDATDIAFMSVFGRATMHEQQVSVRRIGDESPDGRNACIASLVLPSQKPRRAVMSEEQTTDRKAFDDPSAPRDPEENQAIHHPRQEAGQDASIAERLERDPENEEARLDAALDESMDASDPPASTQPVHTHEPPESSGYDAAEEARLKEKKQG